MTVTSTRQRRRNAPPLQQSGDANAASDTRGFGLLRRRWVILAIFVLAVGGGGTIYGVRQLTRSSNGPVNKIPVVYDSERAYEYLTRICDLGPRVSGTEGMARQKKMLVAFFQKQGADVQQQAFQARHPLTGKPVAMTNLVARYGADRPKRFLIAAHYDTRPFPDRDPVRPRGIFLGANDGASGTAGLMELSHHLKDLPQDVGVDLVLFDGEELVYDGRRDMYFWGSTYFARVYAANRSTPRYKAGLLLDMIGDAKLQIYLEKYSWKFARKYAQQVWETAARLNVDAFRYRLRHAVQDDHLPLNKIAKIPTVNIIDFDYPQEGRHIRSYWHTEKDVPENCSGKSIATVVYVVHQWLLTQ